MNLDSARKTFGSFPQLLSLKPSYAVEAQASSAGFMMPGLTWWQLCFELHPSQSLSTCLHQGTPSILNPKRWKFFIKKTLPLWFHMEIRVLYEDYGLFCNSLQSIIVMTLQHIMKNPFYQSIIRFRRNTWHSLHSLPCRGQEEPHVRVRILGRSKKWYTLKQGHRPIWFSEPLNFPRQCLNTMKTCPASIARKELKKKATEI